MDEQEARALEENRRRWREEGLAHVDVEVRVKALIVGDTPEGAIEGLLRDLEYMLTPDRFVVPPCTVYAPTLKVVCWNLRSRIDAPV